jgi:hypothetical protein
VLTEEGILAKNDTSNKQQQSQMMISISFLVKLGNPVKKITMGQ